MSAFVATRGMSLLLGVLTGLYGLSLGVRALRGDSLDAASVAGVGAVLAVWLALAEPRHRSAGRGLVWRLGLVAVIAGVAILNGVLMLRSFRRDEPGVLVRLGATIAFGYALRLLWPGGRREPGS